MDSIDLTRIKRIFDLLGRVIRGPVEVHIAGSIPTLIKGLTARPTGDIDFVDRFPRKFAASTRCCERSRPILASNWGMSSLIICRLDGLIAGSGYGDFGGLRVYILDEYDIFVSKLGSKQKKHQSDLGVLALKLDKEVAKRRLFSDGRSFLDDPKLRAQIEENWRFIFQEPLIIEQIAGPEDTVQRPARGRKGKLSQMLLPSVPHKASAVRIWGMKVSHDAHASHRTPCLALPASRGVRMALDCTFLVRITGKPPCLRRRLLLLRSKPWPTCENGSEGSRSTGSGFTRRLALPPRKTSSRPRNVRTGSASW